MEETKKPMHRTVLHFRNFLIIRYSSLHTTRSGLSSTFVLLYRPYCRICSLPSGAPYQTTHTNVWTAGKRVGREARRERTQCGKCVIGRPGASAFYKREGGGAQRTEGRRAGGKSPAERQRSNLPGIGWESGVFAGYTCPCVASGSVCVEEGKKGGRGESVLVGVTHSFRMVVSSCIPLSFLPLPTPNPTQCTHLALVVHTILPLHTISGTQGWVN